MSAMNEIYQQDGHCVCIAIDKDGHPKIVRESDGKIAVCLVCCGDPGTESWSSFYHAQEIDGKVVCGIDTPATIEDKLVGHAAKIIQRHVSMNAAHKFILERFGRKQKDPSSPDAGQDPDPTGPTMKLHD